jgi:hypothetical protein
MDTIPIRAGATLLPTRGHLWIVVSNPDLNPERVVLANITTPQGKPRDDDIVLKPSDHPWIKHPSRVQCGGSYHTPLQDIEERLRNGSLTRAAPIRATLVGLIREGMINSRRTPEGVRRILNAEVAQQQSDA